MSAHPLHLGHLAWRVAIVATYVARPFSCAAVLALEPRDAADPYRSIDPHGFGVMGAMVAALLFAVPVLWLALQRRPSAPAPAPVLRSAAVLLVLGSPMLLQLTYLNAPTGVTWPIYASSTAWLLALASVCLNRSDRGPSVHGAFDRYPRAAWAIVIAIAAAKAGVLLLAFPR